MLRLRLRKIRTPMCASVVPLSLWHILALHLLFLFLFRSDVHTYLSCQTGHSRSPSLLIREVWGRAPFWSKDVQKCSTAPEGVAAPSQPVWVPGLEPRASSWIRISFGAEYVSNQNDAYLATLWGIHVFPRTAWFNGVYSSPTDMLYL